MLEGALVALVSLFVGYKLGKLSRDEHYSDGFMDGIERMNKKNKRRKEKAGV
jgi:hypothetical protein